jgi:hypothetical protein
VSSKSRRAVAHVSLFSALTFAMELGEVESGVDATAVTHIDPMADHPPNDIIESRHAGVLLTVRKPDDVTAYLREMVEKGVGNQRLCALVAKIMEFNAERDVKPLFEKLDGARTASAVDYRKIASEIVDGQGQRVLNLMQRFAKEIAAGKAGGQAVFLSGAFARLVEADLASASGVTRLTEDALARSKAALVDEICLQSRGLTLEKLLMLFIGGPGMGVVGKTMLAMVLGEAA